MNKVAVTQTLRRWLGIGLADAKAVTDCVLEGRQVEIEAESVHQADRICVKLNGLGVHCHREG